MGEAFGAQAFGVTPDILTMAKAITNGVVPLGAVASREHIYDTMVKMLHLMELLNFFMAILIQEFLVQLQQV